MFKKILGKKEEKDNGLQTTEQKEFQEELQAANQGDAIAQYNLGMKYSKGRGVAISDAKAVEWWQKAANQGQAVAQFNLALNYEQGRGVTQSDAKAIDWYQKAANQSIAQAQIQMNALLKKQAEQNTVVKPIQNNASVTPVTQQMQKLNIAPQAPKSHLTLSGSYLINYAELVLGRKLGQGGFGIVYQATRRHAEVAVK